MNKKLLIIILIFLTSFPLFSQGIINDINNFTRQDTLRGSITKERIWWDLTYYHLDISVDPINRTIKGSNEISYTVLEPYSEIQIDLQNPLVLTKAEQNDENLEIRHDGNAHFIKLKKKQIRGAKNKIKVFYEGKPKTAVRAPWDGGISWTKDKNGNHFVASSCQGLGASVWWPNKDHMYDEVEGMLMSVNVPKGLFNVSNGRLIKIEEKENSNTYHWEVKNPINNYGVNINIGDYVNFSEIYKGESGDLDMDYYVLRDNLEIAKIHFKDAIKSMEAFEHWFGPYPFYEDSFKLVEAPYLGMEHQSSVTYGNKFKQGYLGRDLSGSGWGLMFDYIIIHETGHEWFANNITYKDIADMWIHESFTTYSENLFLDFHFGKKLRQNMLLEKEKGYVI
jgi:aminopeptidase N